MPTATMTTRRLGNSDMHITPLGFGAWAIGGGGWRFGWGPQDDAHSVAAIREALDCGVNWIDTAAIYGLGRSEQIVATALEGVTPRPHVFTKCAMVWDEQWQIGASLKADSIRRECEASLRRLKVDVIDLYQIHWPDPDPEIEEGWSTLARLKVEGKVRWIGVSNFSVEQMKRAQRIAPITSLQPPYSLINRAVEAEILPFCQANNIGVIAYSPMGSGLLTGAITRQRLATLAEDDWRRRSKNFQEPLLSRHLELVELLRKIGARHGRSPGEVAIGWVLRHPAVTGAIVGARKPGQFAEVTGAVAMRLTERDLQEIDAFFKGSPVK
jgi:aryl-alcohol dehydrogenase-like predicted oxidoreductase